MAERDFQERRADQGSGIVFDSAKLLGDTERKIVVHTRLGHSIDNYVEVDPPPAHCYSQYALFVKTHGARWKERKPPTGVYNCAGHVWASRRTTILEPESWRRILEDDGYRPLLPRESPWPGDIVLYLDQDANGEILHVGRVFELAPGLTESSARIPWVISKWNSTFGESLHRAYDVPYGANFNFEVRFYTDRPAKGSGT
jgi:hypothetical protein